jgi:hypothetical protein
VGANDQDFPTKAGVNQIVSDITGMIDTGSDHARIDEDLTPSMT